MPESDVSSQIGATTQWHLQPIGGSSILIIFLVLLGLALIVFLYLRQTEDRRQGLIMIGLRSGLILSIAFLLLNPQLYTSTVHPVRRQVALVVDVSASMEMADAQTENTAGEPESGVAVPKDADLSRLERVKRWLGESADGFLGRLDERWDVRCYDFASECEFRGLRSDDSDSPVEPPPEDWVASLKLRNDATALGSALAMTARDARDEPLTAVILVTDGRSNRGASPLSSTALLADRQIPIFAVGLGRLTAKDIDVGAVAAPPIVFKDDHLTLNATVSQTGFTNQSATARLFRDGEPVKSGGVVEFKLTEDPNAIQFDVVLTEAGAYRYEIRVDVLDDELDSTNNRRSLSVQCIDDALRTLYVEAEPRWEWRFLRDALVRDKRIRHGFETVLLSANDRAATTEPEYRRSYPSTMEQLERYDLIIFGDVNLGGNIKLGDGPLTEEQLQLTADFVGEHAGGFLMIVGRRHAPHTSKDTPIEQLLPIRLSDASVPNYTGTPFRALLTPAGREENALRLVADAEKNDSLWKRLPDLYWSYPILEPRDVASTLLVNRSATTSAGEPQPVLLSRPFGNGTAALLATDNTWRWRSVDNSRYYDLFWGQMIQWLGLPRLRARKQIAQLQVSTDRIQEGESVRITASRPIQGVVAQTIDVSWQCDEDAVQRLTLDAAPQRPGTYQRSIPLSKPGSYRVWMNGEKPGEVLSAHVEVRPAPTELSDPTMNRALLAQVCRQTGGQLYGIPTADKILDDIPSDKVTYRRTQQRPLWGNWLLVFTMILLASGEWFYRRRVNLR